jgi:hypothetical protein
MDIGHDEAGQFDNCNDTGGIKFDGDMNKEVLRELTSPVLQEDGHHICTNATEIEANPIEVLKNYEVGIRFLDKGCLVNVGCKSFAFNTNEEMLTELEEYIKNPSDKTKEYY